MTVEWLLKYQQEVGSGMAQNIPACRSAGDKRQEVAVTAFVGFSELCPSNVGHYYPSNPLLYPPKCCISGRDSEFNAIRKMKFTSFFCVRE
jgi:hypothetical protein